MIVLYSGGAIFWKTQRQRIVTLSSTEAEYVALCSTAKELVWLRNLGIELNIIEDKPILLLSDNTSAIKISQSEKVTQRTRHLGAQESYPRELIERKELMVKHVGASDQLADLMTKQLQPKNFILNRNKILFTLMFLVCLSTSSAYGSSHWQILNDGSTHHRIIWHFMSPCQLINQNDLISSSGYNTLNTGWMNLCEKLYEDIWKTTVRNAVNCVPHKIKKRQLGQIAMISASAVSNLMASEFLGTGIITRQKAADYFSKSFKIADLFVEGSRAFMNLLSQSAENHRRVSYEQAEKLNKILWVIMKAIGEIHANTANMQAIIETCKTGRLATMELAELTGFDQLKDIKPETTKLIEIDNPEHDASIEFTFTVRNKENKEDEHISIEMIIIIIILVLIGILNTTFLVKFHIHKFKRCQEPNIPPVPPRSNETREETSMM